MSHLTKLTQGVVSNIDWEMPVNTCARVVGHASMTKRRSEVARLRRNPLETVRRAGVPRMALITSRGPMEASKMPGT